jgi:hypothetical protein
VIMMTRHSIGRSVPVGAILVFSVLACDDSKTVGTVQNAGGTSALAGTGDTGGALAAGATQSSGGANAVGSNDSGIGGVAIGGVSSVGGVGNGTAATGGVTASLPRVEYITDDAGQLIMPPPVLDPSGTYAGKTLAEWGVAYWKWILELPGPDFPPLDCTSALYTLGPSEESDGGAAPSHVFALADQFGGSTKNITRNCTVPSGDMIFLTPYLWEWDNTASGTHMTDAQIQDYLSGRASQATEMSLEIDGKSYGTTVSDFANYRTVWTRFSYTMPNTPSNFCNAVPNSFCANFSGPVPNAFGGGYWMMLAPLAAGTHAIHFVLSLGYDPYDVTYNLTVE